MAIVFLNGTCNCQKNFIGNNCDQFCIDSNCSFTCVCDDPNSCGNNLCNQNLSLSNQPFSLNSTTLYIKGNMIIDESQISLNSSTMIIDKNISITNSSLDFNSDSSVVANGCINITQSKINVDLNNTQNTKLILLFKSTSSCLNGNSYTVSYKNQPPCSSTNSTSDDSSIVVLLNQNNCNGSSLNIWVIVAVLGAILGVAIIFILLVLTVPRLRSCFLKKRNI